MGEHSGRYAHVADFLNCHGVSVYALDHRGHGLSPGKRGDIPSFQHFVDDWVWFERFVHSREHGRRIYVLGHSLGGLIVIHAAMQEARFIEGVLLSSPLLGISFQGAFLKRAAARVLAVLMPGLSLFTEIDVSFACRDPSIQRLTLTDTLVHHRMTPRMFQQMNWAMKKAWEFQSTWHFPTFLAQAGDDKLVSMQKAVSFVHQSRSSSKMIKVYEGFYHEVLNDIERHRVMEDMLEWMRYHGRTREAT